MNFEDYRVRYNSIVNGGRTMTNEEICRDYRQAKSKTKQIGILAELTAKSRREIIEILTEGGCELPGSVAKAPKAKTEPAPAEEKANRDLEVVLRARELRIGQMEREIGQLKETIVRMAMERAGTANL